MAVGIRAIDVIVSVLARAGGYWRWRPRRPDRPRIPNQHIAFIRRISADHAQWREDRIAEELAIKLDVKHVVGVCREFAECHNGARPWQALHAVPDPYPELTKPPPKRGELVALPVLGGVQHDYRLAA